MRGSFQGSPSPDSSKSRARWRRPSACAPWRHLSRLEAVRAGTIFPTGKLGTVSAVHGGVPLPSAEQIKEGGAHRSAEPSGTPHRRPGCRQMAEGNSPSLPPCLVAS